MYTARSTAAGGAGDLPLGGPLYATSTVAVLCTVCAILAGVVGFIVSFYILCFVWFSNICCGFGLLALVLTRMLTHTVRSDRATSPVCTGACALRNNAHCETGEANTD